MNRFAFNPETPKIHEWHLFYYDQQQLQRLFKMWDKSVIYLSIINSNLKKSRLKKSDSINFDSDGDNVTENLPDLGQSLHKQSSFEKISDQLFPEEKQQKQPQKKKEKIILEPLSPVKRLKKKLTINEQQSPTKILNQLKTNLSKKDSNVEQTLASNVNTMKVKEYKDTLNDFRNICTDTTKQYLHSQTELMGDFVKMKILELGKKFKKVCNFHQQSKEDVKQNQLKKDKVKILFENIFIEAYYLQKMVQHNKQNLQNIAQQYEKQDQSINEVALIIEDHAISLKTFQIDIEGFQKDLRQFYFENYTKKKSKKIKDHNKLQKYITNEIAVNKDDFKQSTTTFSFVNGMFFGFMIFSLLLMLVFRFLNQEGLQSRDDYIKNFRIWRGASYLIFFNWVFGVLLFLYTKYNINYKILLLEQDTFLPKPQAFFMTATVLTFIYLILFGIYLIKMVGFISGDFLDNLGYIMWIINLCFLMNPFPIFNYEGRRYFIKLFCKFLMSLFIPCTFNIFFMCLIVGSWVQPFSDLSYTLCTITEPGSDCEITNRNATFIFAIIFWIYRVVESERFHNTIGQGYIFSRPRLALICAIVFLNMVSASFLYQVYLTDQLFTYWVVSAVVATLVGLNTDIKADWGLWSFYSDDPLLRKNRLFSRKVYFIAMGIDAVLSVGWVLTVSNNMQSNIGLEPLYLLMILSYVELCRKGMWMFFRIEEDQAENVAAFRAMANDSHIYKQLSPKQEEKVIEPPKINQIINETSLSDLNFQEEQQKSQDQRILEQIKKKIKEKEEKQNETISFEKQMTDLLQIIHEIYDKLNWQDEF